MKKHLLLFTLLISCFCLFSAKTVAQTRAKTGNQTPVDPGDDPLHTGTKFAHINGRPKNKVKLKNSFDLIPGSNRTPGTKINYDEYRTRAVSPFSPVFFSSGRIGNTWKTTKVYQANVDGRRP